MAHKNDSKSYSNILIKEFEKKSAVHASNVRKTGATPIQRDRRIHTKGYSGPKT